MTTVVVHRTLYAPIDRVWAIATDIAGSAATISGINDIKMLDHGAGGDFGVGTRWQETRTMMGKRVTEEMWVSAVEPGRSYTVESESRGTHYISRFDFTEPVPGRTEVVLTFTGRPERTAARLMDAVGGALARRPVTKALQRDLDDLAAAAESAPA